MVLRLRKTIQRNISNKNTNCTKNKEALFEMNTRFCTAKQLQNHTFVLLTNQQQIDGVSKNLYP